MRKLIFGILIIAILGVGGYAAYTYYFKSSGGNVEKLIPSGALMVIEANDVQENVEKMANTQFWKAISSIDYNGLIAKSDATPEHAEKLRQFLKSFNEVTSNEYFKKFFGKQVAFVIYPYQMDISSLENMDKVGMMKTLTQMMESFTFVSRVPVDIQITELLSRINNNFGSEVTTEEREYKGHKYVVVKSVKSGVEFGYTLFGDYLVVGLGEKAAQNSIDVYKKETLSLADDALYQEAHKHYLPGAGLNIYFQLESWGNLFIKELDELKELTQKKFDSLEGDQDVIAKKKAEMENSIQQMQKSFAGLKTISISSTLGDEMKSKWVTNFDRGRLNPDMLPFYSCSPEENKTIHLIPKDVLAYGWINCLDLNAYWKQVQGELAKYPSKDGQDSASKVSELEAKMGLSVEGDILASFGKEFGGFINDIKIMPMFPLPLFSLFVEIGDQASLDRLLAKLTSMPMMPIQKEDYKGKTINYMMLPFGEDLQPAYAYVDGYLFISISRNLLKSSIDAGGDKALSLHENPEFKSIPLDLVKNVNSVQFARVGAIFSKAKSLAEWGNSWMSATSQKQSAFAAGGQKRLDEVKMEVKMHEEDIKKLEDEIWDLESSAQTDPAKAEELKAAQSDLTNRKQVLSDLIQEEAELAQTVNTYQEKTPDPAVRQYYLDNLFYPIFKGFESIPAFGAVSTIKEDNMEVNMYLDMTN